MNESLMVLNDLGLHARPAALIAKALCKFDAEVELTDQHGRAANGRSIIGILGLEACKGAIVNIVARGRDAETAIKAVITLFADKFDEN